MESHQETRALGQLISANRAGIEDIFLKYKIDPSILAPRSLVLAYMAFGDPFLNDLYAVYNHAGRLKKEATFFIGYGSESPPDKGKFAEFFDKAATYLQAGGAVAGVINTNVVNRPQPQQGPQDPPPEDPPGEPGKTIFGINPALAIAGVLILLVGIYLVLKNR